MKPARSDDPRMLLIDTSGRIGWVAVAQGSTILGEQRLEESRRHARDLAPAVASLCRQQGWHARELEAVVVSIGPGSYTGLRVGIMSAKTFAYATGCVLLKVPTFRALVEQTPAEASTVDIVADAQQRRLYVQRFDRVAGGWREGELQILGVADWLGSLPSNVWVGGPGAALVDDELPPIIRRVPATHCVVQPASLLQLGLERWRRGEADDFWSVEPLYLRASNAEENWERRRRSQ
jgi:tRNA threonylcarbamoyladenosine biosynthesis protein TsaB